MRYYIGHTFQELPNVAGKVLKAPVKNDNVVDAALSALNAETAALQAAGFSDDAVRNSLVQDYMESGGYSNTGYKKCNNPGNIVYRLNHKLATKGPAMAGNPGYYWACYKSLGDYVQDKKRVLSLEPGKPIDATDYADFAHRLKLNNYYGKEAEASYLAKLQATAGRLRLVQQLVTDSHQDIVKDAGAKDWWGGLSELEKGGIIGGGFLLLILAVKS